MVKATTPQEQMKAFTEEARGVRGRQEARKLVERITTEMKIWETRLSCSMERLSETEKLVQGFGESFSEHHREAFLRQNKEKVQSTRKNVKMFQKSANAMVYFLEDKYAIGSDSDDQALDELQAETGDSVMVNQIGQNVSQEPSGESQLHQESQVSKNSPGDFRESESPMENVEKVGTALQLATAGKPLSPHRGPPP